ncbi:hypothetical protein HOY80DRAFT_992067 [Tuber brumale]|nr:hypothetical protein HOY80DRAFT_992067 [Tuber brumale]
MQSCCTCTCTLLRCAVLFYSYPTELPGCLPQGIIHPTVPFYHTALSPYGASLTSPVRNYLPCGALLPYGTLLPSGARRSSWSSPADTRPNTSILTAAGPVSSGDAEA